MKLKQFLKMKFMGDFITANMLEKVKKKSLIYGQSQQIFKYIRLDLDILYMQFLWSLDH